MQNRTVKTHFKIRRVKATLIRDHEILLSLAAMISKDKNSIASKLLSMVCKAGFGAYCIA